MSGMDVKFERSSAVAVSRGLMVVRYAASGAVEDFPVAVVRAGPTFDRVVEMISAPGTEPGWLGKPGDCVVVRVHETARLEIGLRRSAPSGSLSASFQIEVLGAGKLPETSFESARTVAEPPLTAIISDFREPESARLGSTTKPSLTLGAHVAMRGDVEVGEDQWVAGPNAPAAIEGILLRSAEPERLAIEAQVLVGGAKQWSDWVASGGYAGTRGRGLPLIAVRLRLVGADATSMEINADALFLGTTALSKTGRQIEFVSPAGSDPLVGLKLGVRTVEKSPVVQQSDGPWRDRGSRVRVFRSSAGG